MFRRRFTKSWYVITQGELIGNIQLLDAYKKLGSYVTVNVIRMGVSIEVAKSPLLSNNVAT
ncbi:hypothetical protein GCM10028895_38390 [Pontibacter rugosus]